MKRPFVFALSIAAVVGIAFYAGTRHLTESVSVPAPAAAADAMPARSLAAIVSETDPLKHRTLFTQWLTALTPAEAAAAAPRIWALPGDLNEIAERKKLFCYAWGQTDGEGAIEFARRQPGAGKVTAIGAALAGWASKDPEAAKAWISARMEPGEQLMYAWALVEGWARRDPEAATVYALSMKNLPNAGRFLQSIALEQVRRDPVHAGSWALQLPEGSLREAAVTEIATHWSRSAPQAAADWAGSLTDRTLAVPALRNAVTEWTRIDSTSTGAWLKTMPRSALRDQAVATYCQVVAVQGLESVSEWAATINDTGLREQSLVRIAEEWMARNEEATLTWLPSSGLSSAAQERLRGEAAGPR